MESEDSDAAQCSKYLQEQIAKTEEQLKQLDIVLSQVKSKNIVTVEEQDARHVIFSAKKNLLEQEIAVTASEKPTIIPEYKRLQEELLRNDMQTSVQQMEVLLKLVQSQRQELKESVEREQDKEERLDTINQDLEKVLEKESREESETEYQEESVIAKLTQRQEALDNYLSDISGKMVQFITTHYPPPTQEKLRKPGEKGQKYASLKTIIKDLFTKTVDQQHDPYITLEEKHWEPYIEMLLRCRLASRHPQDPNQIKLTPYHL